MALSSFDESMTADFGPQLELINDELNTPQQQTRAIIKSEFGPGFEPINPLSQVYRLRGKRFLIIYPIVINGDALIQYLSTILHCLSKWWVVHLQVGYCWETCALFETTKQVDCQDRNFFNFAGNSPLIYPIDGRKNRCWQAILSYFNIAASPQPCPSFQNIESPQVWQYRAFNWLFSKELSTVSKILNLNSFHFSNSTFDFCKWIDHYYSESVAIFPDDIPTANALGSQLRSKLKRGWNGKYIVINLTALKQSSDIKWWSRQAKTLQSLRHGGLTGTTDAQMGTPPAGILILSRIEIRTNQETGFDDSNVKVVDLDQTPELLRAPTSEEGLTSKHFSNATKPKPQLTHLEVGLAMKIQYTRKDDEEEVDETPKIQLPPFIPAYLSDEDIKRMNTPSTYFSGAK